MSKENQLKVAVCEMTSTSVVAENLEKILKQLEKVADCRVAFFPENSLLIRTDKESKMLGLSLSHEAFGELIERAKSKNLDIVLGSVPMASEGTSDKVLNATVHITREGEVSVPYTKVHLFDVDIEDGPSFRESDDYIPGRGPQVIEIDGWKVGLSICYDLRFSNLYLEYALKEVDIITVPSAFTVPTGKAHWETLLRARAIESQCYVLAPAQEGAHGGDRVSYGHSMIVDPWGKVVSEADSQRRELLYDLSLSEILKVRRQIPMASHRKVFG